MAKNKNKNAVALIGEWTATDQLTREKLEGAGLEPKFPDAKYKSPAWYIMKGGVLKNKDEFFIDENKHRISIYQPKFRLGIQVSSEQKKALYATC